MNARKLSIPRSAGSWLAVALLAAILLIAGCATSPSSTAPIRGDESWKNAGVHDVTGRMRKVRTRKGDNLIELARTHRVGYVELLAANPGVDPWVPEVGGTVVLPQSHVLPPGPREGVVVNLAEQRLYYYAGDSLTTFPIGVSRDGWATPTGSTKITRKVEGPTWYPGKTARRDDPSLGASVPPGPENPLGSHALYLGWPLILIHGTNEPYGIGRQVSRGCIRLYPEDIPKLFASADVGTPVRVINEPIKVGRYRGQVVLEAHPNARQAGEIEKDSKMATVHLPDVSRRIRAVAGPDAERVDWERVERVLTERRGVPYLITR